MFLEVKQQSGKLDLSLPTRLQISMFNPNCSGQALTAIVIWLAQQRVSELEFQVSDTLQRHNFEWRKSVKHQVAATLAHNAGEEWLNRNRNAITLSTTLFEKVSIVRWNFWIERKDHKLIEEEFRSLSGTDPEFAKSLEAEVSKYFLKSKRTDQKERREKSLDFLLEEIAVSELSARDYLTNEIYPGQRFLPEEYLISRYGQKYSLSKQNFIHLDFEMI